MSDGDGAAGFRIRHTMLRVAELERSVKFYTGLLGMVEFRRREDDDELVCYVGYGDAEDAVHALELVQEKDHEGGFEMGNCYGHVALAVPDIYALSEELKKAGVKFPLPPRPLRPDSPNHVAFILDPDGYEIELTERH